MMSGTSMLSWDIDWRNRRSFRQCPILDTMMRTRGFWATDESSKSMDSDDTVLENEVRSCSRLLNTSTGTKCTLMKNFLDVGSPNCCESLMFRLCSVRNPVTA